MIKVTQLAIIPHNDNYAYILEGENGEIAVMDPGDATPFIDALEAMNKKPDIILLTHHHWDHTDGLNDMLAWHDCPVAGPEKETGRIPQITIPLSEGKAFSFGGEKFEILDTPGHTAGHISYYAPESGILFCGDTLFAMGCGRLFEGTAQDMWDSLQKLKTLPDETIIYCSHEYTLSNAQFGVSIAPDNEAIASRLKEVKALRDDDKPTIPTTIGLEKETNLFLRAKSAEEFAQLRQQKDSF